MSELVQIRPLITMETPLKEIPKEWLDVIEYRIEREGWDGCWIWNGAQNMKTGMPLLIKDGKMMSAQRWAMALFYNFDKTYRIKTTCDRRNCMNPNHLLVTDIHPRSSAWFQ